jgi:phosphate transport system protein
VARAWVVWERDADLDTLEGGVFGDLLSQMIDDPRSITDCTHVLAASKAIERIGDHAANVAETVIYLVAGAAVVAGRLRGRGAADIALDGAADDF